MAAETPEDLAAVQQLWTEKESAGAGESVGKWTVKTLGEVAEFLGVELVTVRDWRTGPIPMPGKPGCYNLKEIVAWRCDRLKTSGGIQKPKEVLELELREKQIDVAKKELALRKSRGDLVSRAAAKAKVFEILNDARCQLEAVPGIVGAHVNPEFKDDLVNEWEQQIGLILRTMAGKAEASSA